MKEKNRTNIDDDTNKFFVSTIYNKKKIDFLTFSVPPNIFTNSQDPGSFHGTNDLAITFLM